MKALFFLARALFGRLSLCSLSGGIVGGIAGFLFGMLQGQFDPFVLVWPDVLRIGLLLALVGWLAVLLIVGIWLRYGVAAIFLVSLVNAILTAVLTVYLNNLIQQPPFATLIGILVGILVGYVLCWYCRKRSIDRR